MLTVKCQRFLSRFSIKQKARCIVFCIGGAYSTDQRRFAHVPPVRQRRVSNKELNNLGRLIYSAGTVGKLVRFVKLFSLSTTGVAFIMQPIIWQDMLSSADRSTLLTAATLSFLSVLVMCTPLLLNVLTKRYAIAMYHDAVTDQFSVLTLNLLAQRRVTTFTFDQLHAFNSPFQLANVIVDRYPFLLVTTNFLDEQLMERFKPLLGEEEEPRKNNTGDDDEDGLV